MGMRKGLGRSAVHSQREDSYILHHDVTSPSYPFPTPEGSGAVPCRGTDCRVQGHMGP